MSRLVSTTLLLVTCFCAITIFWACGSDEVALKMELAVDDGSLPVAFGASEYAHRVRVTEGTPPFTWGVSSPEDPQGRLSISPVPDTSGRVAELRAIMPAKADGPPVTWSLNVTVQDVNDIVATFDLSLELRSNDLGFQDGSGDIHRDAEIALPNAVVNATYEHSLRVVGGVPPYDVQLPSAEALDQIRAFGLDVYFDADDSKIWVLGVPSQHTDTERPLAFDVSVTDARGASSMLQTRTRWEIVTTQPGLVFTLRGLELAEDDGSNADSYGVSLFSPPAADVTVALTSSDAAHGATMSPDRLIFTPSNWSTVQNVTVLALDDDRLEGDHAATISHNVASSDPAFDLGQVQDVTVSIADNNDEPTIAFATSESSNSEAQTTIQLPVRLSSASALPVSVNYEVVSQGATSGTDFMGSNGTLTFAPDVVEMFISVELRNDDVAEGNEELLLRLMEPDNGVLSETQSQHRFHIVDDDGAPSVSFGVSSSTVSEGAPHSGIELVLSRASSSDVRVDYAVVGGDAGRSDFSLSPGTIVIPAGSTTASVGVQVIDDTRDEGDETFVLQISNPQGAVLGAITQHEYTIADDDTQPTVGFVIASSARSERDGAASIQVALSTPSNLPVTVDYEITAGDATAGSDFQANLQGTLTFEPGAVLASIDVAVTDDGEDEPDEGFVLQLANPGNATLGRDRHEYTIVDDDGVAGVRFAQASSEAFEGDETTDIEVILDNTSGRTVTVSYEVVAGTAGKGDYVVPGSSLEFAPGTTRQWVRVQLANDTVPEPDETVQLRLTAADNAVLGEPRDHELTIHDGDSNPVATFVAATTNVHEGELASIAVALSAASEQTVTVDYRVIAQTAQSSDHALQSGRLQFSPGSTQEQITFSTADDDLSEGDETFQIELIGGTNAVVAPRSLHRVTIVDDEGSTAVQFAQAVSSGDEAASPARIEVILTEANPQTVTVDYEIGEATSATEGDYSLAAGSLSFAPGETSKSISIGIVDDTLDEGEETIEVVLTRAEGAPLSGNTQHVYTIVDNDGLPRVAFAALTSSQNENGSSASLAVTLNIPSQKTVSVEYEVSDGTASPGDDYNLGAGQLTFAPGDVSQEIVVPLVDDSVDEGQETVTVTLSDPVEADLGVNTSHTLTIIDDDGVPVVFFAESSSLTDEDDESVEIELELSRVSAKSVTVDFSAVDGTASRGDFTADGTVTFEPGETTQALTVVLHDDATAEPTETIVLELANPVEASLGSPVRHELTVLDRDPDPTISWGDFESSLGEGGSISIQAQLDAASEKEITVGVAVDPASTASEGADFTVNASILVFAPGETQATATVSATDDVIAEETETIVFTLVDPTNAAVAGEPATVSIDDDEGAVSVAFAEAAMNLAEGVGTAVVEVALSQANHLPINVAWSVETSASTATDADHGAVAGTVHFPAGTTTATIEFPVVNDSQDETDETIVLSLSSEDVPVGSPASTTLTILDDDGVPTVSFSLPSSSGPENESPATFIVVLSHPSQIPVDVDWAVGTGGSADSSDLDQAATGTLTYAPGVVELSFDVPILDDDTPEDDETFVVEIRDPVNAVIGVGSHTFTIVDEDAFPQVTFATPASSLPENVTQRGIFLNLSRPSESAAVVGVQISFGGGYEDDRDKVPELPQENEDIELSSPTVTFPPGVTSMPVPAVVIDDLLNEFDESYTLTLTPVENVFLGVRTSHTHTIVDDDPLPVVGFTSATFAGDESESAQLDLTLDAPSGRTVSLTWSVVSGTADGDDYSVTSGFVAFEPGDTAETITIPVVDDGLYEIDEAFDVSVGNVSHATAGASSATYTIQENDFPVVTFYSQNESMDEDAGNDDLHFEIDAASDRTITVTWAASGGSASVDSDYSLPRGQTVTFAPGSTNESVEIAIHSDGASEFDETIEYQLTEATNATVDNSTVTYTIQDDDFPLAAFAQTQASSAENVGTVSVDVTLSFPSVYTLRVPYSDGSIHKDGGAEPGSDYVVTPDTLVFAPGDTTASFDVSILDDTLDEHDETFHVLLGEGDGYVRSTGDLSSTHVRRQSILDDDDAPEINFMLTNPSGSESVTPALLTLELSAVSGKQITVEHDGGVNGPAKRFSEATRGVDFLLDVGTVTFAPGETQKDIAVTIVDDDEFEDDEFLIVNISNPSNVTLGSAFNHLYTIQDNDSQPTVGFEGGVTSQPESVTAPAINVVLSNPSETPVSVNYNATNGSAVGGADFSLAPGTLTFAPGEVSKTISPSIVNDTVFETDEAFSIQLTNASNATLGTSTHIYSILNDDSEPSASFSTSSASGSEAVGTVNVAVELSNPSSEAVVVGYGVTGGTASPQDDFVLEAGNLVFVAGETSKSIPFTVSNDTNVEPDETIVVSLSNSINGSIGSPSSFTYTIENDDTAANGQIILTVDNEYWLWVNGSLVGADLNWGNTETYQVSLSSGDVVAIHGIDRGGSWGVRVQVDAGGSTYYANANWKIQSSTPPSGWQNQGFDDSSWPLRTVVPGNGNSPGDWPGNPGAPWFWDNGIFPNGQVFARFVIP